MNTTERATINDRSVILDSGSTISLFKSKHFVTDIRDTKDKIQLETNGGTRIVDKEGFVCTNAFGISAVIMSGFSCA